MIKKHPDAINPNIVYLILPRRDQRTFLRLQQKARLQKFTPLPNLIDGKGEATGFLLCPQFTRYCENVLLITIVQRELFSVELGHRQVMFIL